MKRIFIFIPVLLAFVVALSAPCPTGAAGAPSVDPRKAARDAFDSIKYSKDIKYLEALEAEGHISRADLEKAELGEGFQIFNFLNPIDALIDDAPYDPAVHVTPTSYWEFLIRVEGKAKTLLSLFFNKRGGSEFAIGIPPKGNWRAHWPVYSARVAKELDGLLAAWPVSAGYQHRIISDIAGLSPYEKLFSVIELSKDGKVLGFIPLSFAYKSQIPPEGIATAGNFTAADLLDPNLFLAKLRSETKRNKKLNEKQLEKK